MQQPENLVARLVVIGFVGVTGDDEVHGNGGVSHGAGRQCLFRHIRLRLPEDDLVRALILARAGDHLANAGQGEIDSMPGVCVEAQVDRALE